MKFFLIDYPVLPVDVQLNLVIDQLKLDDHHLKQSIVVSVMILKTIYHEYLDETSCNEL